MRDASGVNLVFDDQGNAVSRAALEDAALGAELRDGAGDPVTGLELWQSYYGPDGGSVLFLADSSGTALAGYAANEQMAWLTGLSADSFFAATVLPLADGEQPLGGNQNFRAVRWTPRLA